MRLPKATITSLPGMSGSLWLSNIRPILSSSSNLSASLPHPAISIMNPASSSCFRSICATAVSLSTIRTLCFLLFFINFILYECRAFIHRFSFLDFQPVSGRKLGIFTPLNGLNLPRTWKRYVSEFFALHSYIFSTIFLLSIGMSKIASSPL